MSRRPKPRPYGVNMPSTRLASLIMMLVLIAVLFQRARDPGMWRWLTGEPAPGPAAQVVIEGDGESKPSAKDLEPRGYRARFSADNLSASTPIGVPADALKPDNVRPESLPEAVAGNAGTEETAAEPLNRKRSAESVFAGLNDLDEDEAQNFEHEALVLRDKKPLQGYEMPAYWRLVQWSLTQPWADEIKRSMKDVPFTHLFETPKKFRGKLIHLHLHVRRVLEYDAPENELGLEKLYEAWGATDDSKSYLYCVVFAEKPPGLPIGTEVYCDAEFTGYFLKTLAYQGFEKPLPAPLLIGRIRVDNPVKPLEERRDPATAWMILWGLVVAAVVGIGVTLLKLTFGKPMNRRISRDRLMATDRIERDELPETWEAPDSREKHAAPDFDPNRPTEKFDWSAFTDKPATPVAQGVSDDGRDPLP